MGGDGETEDEKLLGTRHFKTTRRRGETETRRRRQKTEGGRQEAGGSGQEGNDAGTRRDGETETLWIEEGMGHGDYNLEGDVTNSGYW